MFAKFRHRLIPAFEAGMGNLSGFSPALLFILALLFLNLGELHSEPAKTALALPNGLSEQLFTLPEGAAEVRAKQPLANVAKSYQLPDWIARAANLKGVQKIDPRMQRGALREFALAKLLLNQGKVEQAVQRLRLARMLSPKSPDVYRKLALLYERMGESQRALSYYKDLLKVAGDDAPSLYVLGKHELNRANNRSAIALLNKAQKQAAKNGDSIISLLSQFQLAQALQRQGHDLAAVEVMRSFFEQLDNVRPTQAYLKDFTVALQSQPILYMLMGDSLMRLKDHSGALNAYQQSEKTAMRISSSLSRRLIYVHLLLNKPDEALLVLQKLMSQPKFLSEAMALSRYWIANTKSAADKSPQAQLIDKLKSAYISSGRPANLVIGLSEIKQSIEKNDGWQLLTEHLRQKPEDTQVYRYLLDHVNQTDEAEKAAVTTTLHLMKTPEAFYSNNGSKEVAAGDLAKQHYKLAAYLYGSIGKTSRISAAIEQVVKENPQMSIKGNWLEALCHLQSRYPESALASLKSVFKTAPQWQSEIRRVAGYVLGSRLVREPKRHDMAASLLSIPYEGADSQIQLQRLLAKVDLDTDRKAFAKALKRLDDAIGPKASDDTPVELILTKADVLWLKGNADKKLQGMDRYKAAIQYLGQHRKLKAGEKIYEKLYAYQNLIYSLTERKRDPEEIAKIAERRKETLALGIAQLPKSRVVRLQEAIVNGQDRASQAASLKILIGLYKEDDQDADVLHQMLLYLIALEQNEQARRLLESARLKRPDNTEIIDIAILIYSRLGDWEASVEMEEQRFLLEPKSISRDVRLADFYLRWDRHDEAHDLMSDTFDRDINECGNLLRILGLIQLKRTGKIDDQKFDEHLDWLIKAFPDEIAELRYERAVLYDLTDNDEKFTALLKANEKLAKVHTPSLNFLGYHYARLGQNLAEGEKLLKKAIEVLESEPGEPWQKAGSRAAYQDSLAWIYYKQGDFQKAVTLLEKAATARFDPVILDHLGDTYWRLNRPDDARRMWRYSQAQSQSDRLRMGMPLDPESNEVLKRVTQKLNANGQNENPKIAPVGASDIWQNVN